MNNCSKCGAPVQDGKCTYCGAEFPAETPQPVSNTGPANAPAYMPQAGATYVQQPIYINVQAPVQYSSSSPKSKVVAIILAVFFGYIGLHHFYVGKVGMGILYIFTCGLFCIGWIVDIIKIAGGNFKDSNGLSLN